ncbi:hypothetical protein BV25DRAFT_225110 [Artomyces pyxidatus]|uniref:Uncharacterized protein n=1 Tax=Artomyces pyxidatus TaxID=48021 RepID=A0ACB8T924_9AGAM|nr:hypothetical protein BV25DRAFT_225110 [Artomyces pyxidatus]
MSPGEQRVAGRLYATHTCALLSSRGPWATQACLTARLWRVSAQRHRTLRVCVAPILYRINGASALVRQTLYIRPFAQPRGPYLRALDRCSTHRPEQSDVCFSRSVADAPERWAHADLQPEPPPPAGFSQNQAKHTIFADHHHRVRLAPLEACGRTQRQAVVSTVRRNGDPVVFSDTDERRTCLHR